MPAPPIDKRSFGDIVAWTERLASCPRAVPGPGLLDATLDDDVIDPTSPDSNVIVPAGTRLDPDLVERIVELAWLDVPALFLGTALGRDIANPANQRVYPAGTIVDAALGETLADLARVAGPEILVGCTLAQPVPDSLGPHMHEPGAVVDETLAAVIDRVAWVRIRTWQPRPDGGPDPGRALVQVAGRFAELVVERINRAPEKHELAFLNLTGAQPLPPRPARVPLTFSLAPGSPVGAVVAAGTQVTATPQEGEEDEVVFETDRGLVVTRSLLTAVFVSDPETDTYSDRTDRATGLVDRPFAAFDGDQPTPHELFLACDELLTQPGAKDVTVSLRSSNVARWSEWPITWAYGDGDSWQDARVSATNVGRDVRTFTLAGLPPLEPTTVHNRTGGFLRAQLRMPLPPARSGLAPESVASGNRHPEDLELPLGLFGETSQVKWFYMSVDEAVALGRAYLRIRIELARPGAGAGMKLSWTYRAGNEWRPLGQSTPTSVNLAPIAETRFSDQTQALTRNGEIGFFVPADWPREQYRNRIGRWLRVEIADDGASYTTLPLVKTMQVSTSWDPAVLTGVRLQLNATPQPQAPTAAVFNNDVLDLSKDLYPFGEHPRFDDTLYLALPDAYARPRAGIRMRVALRNPPGTASPKEVFRGGNPRLSWEIWDGRAWRVVAANDGTLAFTQGGEVTLTLPETMAPTAVQGEEGRWLRVRLLAGNYGAAAYYTEATDKAGNTIYKLEKETFSPPILQSVTVEPVAPTQPEAVPSAFVTRNDFSYSDRTAAAAGPGNPFIPFTPATDPIPALYLGFDQPFEPRPTSLYLQVEPPLPEDVASDQLGALDRTTLAQVAWEYRGPDGWRSLGALDETQGLASRGVVSFVGPGDFTPWAYFDQPRYWLRMRWLRGYFPVPPRLRRVLLNTIWARQVVSVDDEILGSSNGDPSQSFATAHNPVQPGQRIMVRERDEPAPDEQAALTAVEGPDAVQVTRDAVGRLDEVWVRWHGVPDFYASGPRDRHYTIDPMTGRVRFGDGQRGMVPPPGQNNLRASYQTGGGEHGNRPAQSVVQLTSGVPYVEGVTNHEPAEGGAPREPIERLRARAPQALRHGYRAVTAQDLEDLAYAASSDVARAAAVSPSFDPYNLWLEPTAPRPSEHHRDAEAGRMGVIVVPTSDVPRPTPSLGLLSEVQAYLEARCSPTADLWVAGPEWVRVKVDATVVPTSLDTADLAATRAREALERFLHPLTGGLSGDGWSFGRKPHRSDLFALVEAVEGVDHVQSLAVTHEPETQDPNRMLALQRMLDQTLAEASGQPPAPELKRWLDRALVYSGQHRITVALDR